MADLFTLTAPLQIRRGDGARHIVAECFPLAETLGLVYFELYWHLQRPAIQAIHAIHGEIRGDGPWKVADNVITVLGCHGTDPELATSFAEWQQYLHQGAPGYPTRQAICALARSVGARTE
ncbi:MAG: hypothetical protein HZB57_07105 [Gammaproteobacteria bacterium]|nr:hypothetical protein [Gammaproteobacteria bacterium]